VTRSPLILRASLAVLCAVTLLGVTQVAGAAKRTPPKEGAEYSGRTDERQKLTLNVASSELVQIVAFKFACDDDATITGSTSLQDIEIRKPSRHKRYYRLAIRAFALVGYSDEKPEDNGLITIKGRFSRTARRIEGVLRVKTPRCGSTGTVEWRARKKS
jgi:hypothetical protein